ncbi:MAG: thioredoxin [Candidatus Avoscillospira sp.]
MEYTLTKENFDKIALGSQEPILVDFWATWCGPCRMLGPIVEKLSETHKVGKVNVDEQMELAQRYGISSIPALLVFKGGKLVNSSVGYQSLESLEALMEV